MGLKKEKDEESGDELVKGEELGKAVKSPMEGEESGREDEGIEELARKAMEEGGSSYSTLATLVWTKRH